MLISGLMSLGGSDGAGRDTWISAFLVVILAVPMYYIYFYPLKSFKNKDIFQIHDIIYGEKVGFIISLIYILTVGLVFVVSFARYSVFVKTVALEKTPILIIAIFMIITVIYACVCGFETVARFSEIVIYLIVIFLVFTLVVAYSTVNTENLQPILESGIQPVFKGMFSIFASPYLESFALISLFSNVYDRNKVPKVLVVSTVISALVIGVAFLRNLLILGNEATQSFYYPSYQAISLITFGSFFQRQEVTVSATFLIADIIRLSVFSIFITKGINYFLRKRELVRTSVVIIIGLGLVSVYFLGNTIKVFTFIDMYKRIIFIPLVILPCITALISLIKIKERN